MMGTDTVGIRSHGCDAWRMWDLYEFLFGYWLASDSSEPNSLCVFMKLSSIGDCQPLPLLLVTLSSLPINIFFYITMVSVIFALRKFDFFCRFCNAASF